MFDAKKVKEIVLSSLVADAYSLGAHWIYDDKQLQTLDVNWDELNDAKSIWHKGKCAGDFTHYGDQTLWLYQFLLDKEKFVLEDYIEFWQKKMEIYNGYIDGATRQTQENIKEGVNPTGSASTDMSIVGRIAPLLLVSSSREEFYRNVEKFVQMTHNSSEAVVTADFFAKLLVHVLDGDSIPSALLDLKDRYNSNIQAYIQRGIDSQNADTFDTIRIFGPACDIDGGFSGVIHLLSKYDNFKDMMVCNAKAGGDSSARGMLAAIIFMAQENKNANMIPQSWLGIKATII